MSNQGGELVHATEPIGLTMRGTPWNHPYDTHDGQRFLFSCRADPPGRFVVLLDWTEQKPLACVLLSRDNLAQHLAMHIRQSKIPTAIPVGQLRMIQPEQV